MMRDVGEYFRNVMELVFWLDLWKIYGVFVFWRWDFEMMKKMIKDLK